jgi:hypothetical protein
VWRPGGLDRTPRRLGPSPVLSARTWPLTPPVAS